MTSSVPLSSQTNSDFPESMPTEEMLALQELVNASARRLSEMLIYGEVFTSRTYRHGGGECQPMLPLEWDE